jgi:hypothetical protein
LFKAFLISIHHATGQHEWSEKKTFFHGEYWNEWRHRNTCTVLYIMDLFRWTCVLLYPFVVRTRVAGIHKVVN